MPRPDEGLIHAWLDGELAAEEAARVEHLVATDTEWSAAAADARGLIAASSRILSALDVVAGDVIPQGGSAAPALASTAAPRVSPRATPRRVVPAWMKMAAGIALVAGIGYAARDGVGSSAPKETQPAAEMVDLAKASDTTEISGRDLGSVDERAAVAPSGAAPFAAAPAAAPAATAPSADRPPTVASASIGAAGAVANLAADARQRASADPEQRLRDAPSPVADAVAPITATRAAPSAAPSVGQGAATAGSALIRARQAPTDTQAPRRALGENRLEGVVVTGITSDAGKPSAERTGARALQQQAAKSAAPASPVSPPAAALRAETPPLPIIEGCFRVRTRARIDTLLIDPRILATDADSIRIEIASAGFAWVRRDSKGALVGRVWWQRGTATMRADPIDCS